MCFGMEASKEVSYTPNAAVSSGATAGLNTGQKLLTNVGNNTSYGTQYTGNLTAALSPGQQGTIDAATGIANNGTGDAASSLISQYAGAPAQSVTAGTIADNMSPYMNQYVMQALAPQLHQADINDAAQRANLNSTATSSGAFGDARAGIEGANLAFGQNVARQGLIGNAYNTAFNTAIGAGAQDVSNKLSADNANAGYMESSLARALGGSQALQGLQTQQIGAQTSANQLNQQDTAQQQAALTAAYNNWLQAQQSGLQALHGNTGAVSAATGAMPATQTTSEPNNSGMALGGALLGSIFSDMRLKDDIETVGELRDGTPVYSYRYKGDPLRRTQIGLMAQDVKKRRPDAVITLPDDDGTMMVNYALATENSRLMSMSV